MRSVCPVVNEVKGAASLESSSAGTVIEQLKSGKRAIRRRLESCLGVGARASAAV